MRARQRPSLRLVAGALAAAALPSVAVDWSSEVELAAWNLEWLIAPRVFRTLKSSCAPDDVPVRRSERRLPCDVAYGKERAASDFAALARYAAELDADVIALQEVDGPEAAQLVFPGHSFCFTSRPHLQNTGFAIRAGVPHRCGRDVDEIALGDSVRRGAELVLFPGSDRELRLLSIHLKSGCARDPLGSPREACRDLTRQTAALESWIDEQARWGRRFAVLGDFNRDLLREARQQSAPFAAQGTLWGAIDDGDPPEADLVNVLQGERFVNCAAGQPFRSYIDFIVLSRSLGQRLVPGSFQRVTYQPADVWRFRLSDHCPVSIRVRP
jgi:endonuclease/exonuclease/phosphatase family metal-dependent hydrolase